MALGEKHLDPATIQDTPDALPEFCHYRDEGCELATRELGQPSRCARCPFPECLYAEPAGQRKWLKGLRDREILAQFRQEGKTVKELANCFQISKRTVQRVLKRTKND
ncbi:MAG: helix-turn-helix domain-containing protein [Chloroflexota bacterium]